MARPLLSANKSVFFALLAINTSSSLVAEPAMQQEMETVRVSATRMDTLASDLSNSITALSSEDIQLIGHTHISETLGRIPGVWISRGNGQEQLPAIRSAVLTGPGSCGAFYMAEDGISLRAPGFCNVNQLFDANTEQAKRIEVIRGPGTAIHGSNALNGVVNVLSQSPSNSRETSLALEAGANDYSRIKASTSDSHGRHSYVIYANGSHDGGFKDDSGYDQQKLNMRYNYDADRWQLQSGLSLQNLNQETAGFLRQGEEAYKDDDLKDLNENPEAYRDSQSARAYTRFEMRGINDEILVITPYVRHTKMAFLQHFLPGTPLEENGQSSIGMQTGFYHQYSKNVKIHNGFDIDYTQAWLKQSQEGTTFTSFPSGDQYDYDVNALNIAAYLGAEIDLEQGQLNAGGRFEMQRYDYENNLANGNLDANGNPCPSGDCRYSRPGDRKDRYENLSFYLGYIRPLNDSLNFVAHGTQGFRAPQATELYRLQQTQTLAKLDPEELLSVEAGFRFQGDTLSGELIAYAMKKRNVILQTDDRQNVSDGQTDHKGIEFNLTWQLSEHFALHSQGSYAKHQYSENVGSLSIDGNEIDTAPKRTASVQLQWKPNTKSVVEIEWRHIGEYYLDPANEHLYEGHDLINLRLKHSLTDNLWLALRVNNLADTDYAERADFIDFNGIVDPADFRYFVGEPRSVYGEVGLTF